MACQQGVALTDRSRVRGYQAGGRQGGQSLVEFALAIPFLAVLFMGIIEFALAMGATLAVSRASQDGARLAASAGNIGGADCLILRQVEDDIAAPNRDSSIVEVEIARTAMVGNQVFARQLWRRAGFTDCDAPRPDHGPPAVHPRRSGLSRGGALYRPGRLPADDACAVHRGQRGRDRPLQPCLGDTAGGGTWASSRTVARLARAGCSSSATSSEWSRRCEARTATDTPGRAGPARCRA